MNRKGEIIDSTQDPKLDKDFVIRMYKAMTSLNAMDKILYESQRQVCYVFFLLFGCKLLG